jgi:Tfp pilus tip-associated adhesin PilY1
MKHADLAFASSRLGASALAAVVAATVATASLGAPTDISSTPIVTTSAALVKPNVMLLMDNSGSMGRTHMPDEVESVTGVTSVGYKAAQCNALYYNPATNYKLPRDASNNPFAAVSFNNAPYAGFGAYYLVPDTSTRDLRTQFIAYENATLDVPTPFPDTPGPGYYYVYTGPEPLGYTAAACKQLDTGVSAPTPGGGLWTRYNVATQSLAEQTNFAIWYSFYRTRLALTKSAASFAFAPINDTRRVGYISVEPKDTPVSAAINPVRFLPLGDFNAAQKNLWFAKVFSQEAHGASPAREGLARVGRYYGGQEDSINSGMPATGAADPIQYACQQNFTIMTTDGYWNGHTETPGGGGVMLDGVTLVGQQDGSPACTVADPYCKRPMWDGGFDSVHVVTDKSNAYTDNACSLSGVYRSTFQNQEQVSLLTRDSSRTQQRTIQYTQSTQQSLAATTQTTQTVTQTSMTTTQYALREEHFVEERYQHVKSQEQTTQVNEQYQLQTSQVVEQSFQTHRITSQVFKDEEQYTTAKSQYVTATTQYVTEVDQYVQSRAQKMGRQFLSIAYDWTNEHGTPVDGDCVPSPGNRPIECLEQEVGSPAPIDPASCPVAPATVVVNPVTHVKTTCSDGPMTQAAQPVPTCTPGVTAATVGNGWVTTQCNLNVIAPAAPLNGSCAGTTTGAAPAYLVSICTRPPANNVSAPVASCTVGSSTDPVTFITTTCSQPVGPNNQPASASLPCAVGSTTDGSFVTTTCAKPIDFHGWAATCVADPGTAPPYDKVVCTPNPLTNDVVAAGSCVAGNTGAPNYVQTTCSRTASGPFAVAAPQAACAADPGLTGPDFYEITCVNPPATNQTNFVAAAACGPLGITNSGPPNFITSDCRKPAGANNQTTFADPRTCIADPGTAFPYLHVTCTVAQTMPPTVVDPTLECTTFGVSYGGAPDYTVTHCDKRPWSPPTPVAACVPTNSGPPDFVVTTCGIVDTDTPVAFCALGVPLPDDGISTVTCVQPAGPNNAGPTNVASCTQQSPPVGPNFVQVLCSGPNVISSGAVNPASCSNSVGPPPNVYVTTCTTAPVGPYPVPTPVAGACVTGTDPVTFVTTTCSTPPGPNNMAATNSAPCTEGSTTDANQVTTTCAKSDTTVFVATAACVNTVQAGNGPEIDCSTVTTLDEPVASCASGAVQPASPFDTTIACHTTVTSPMADFPGTCSAGPGANPGETVTCNLRPIDVLVADSGCVAGTTPGGLKTNCDTLPAGTGNSYTSVTTTTVTTTPFSGAVPSGPGTSVTTSTAPAPVSGGACFPLPQVFPPKPPVDIAGCMAWPCDNPSLPGAPGSQNSLADVAQYYYKTDLRPLMADIVPPVGTGTEDDSATHQHMTTFALALGVSGTLQFRSDYRSPSTVVGDFAAIRAGTKDWPVWPDPLLTYASPGDYNNPKSIDDYWHTAVDGRGKFFNANDATSAAQGLRDALAATGNQLASGSADGTSTLQPSATDNFAYSTKYQTATWRGDVEARLIDPATGILGPKVWSASDLLDQRTFGACDNRAIYVMRGANPLGQFTWQTDICPGGMPTGSLVTDINAGEQGLLGGANVALLSQFPFMTDGTGIPATALQQQAAQAPGALVNYLRGQRGTEGFVANSLTGLFRTRDDAVLGHAVLGDIVDSTPVYVQTPFADYLDVGYSAFKAANAGRTPMIYVGANDGMLHAFYATLDTLDPLHGQEAWAVIPSSVLPNLYKLADDGYNHGGHQFYVDATPTLGDIWTGGAWKTILVGGLNAGGKGYYALDVTVPGVAPVPLWEFKQNPVVCPATPALAVGNTGDCNLGLTFGKPVITKLAGTWVVMFTSGYNNANGASNGGDGGGFLYVLNATTGAIIYKIPTEVGGVNVGTPATPSGLAQINNFVDNVLIDNTTLRAYGGDVLGNIWRFDFQPAPLATLIGQAKDPGGVAQPITVRPELAELDGKPFVMVGTGRLLGSSDVLDPQVQSVYGLRDPLIGPGPIYPDPMRNLLQPMKVSQVGTGATAVRTIACTGSAADCSRPDGWVLDLFEAGERVNVDMKLVLGALVFASNVPEEAPCTVGGHSWFNQVDFRTGGPIPGAITSQYLSDSLNVGFNVVQLQGPPGSNPTYAGDFRQSKAENFTKPVTPPSPIPVGRRISWREIPAP